MEITIDKPHQTIYHFNGEAILDMKYSYTLTKIVNFAGTAYEVEAHPSSSETDWGSWNEMKKRFVEDIILKHYETHGAE
jgi:hypothetical protein